MGVELAKGIRLLGIGFGGYGNQGDLVGPVFEVAVYRVVAQIGRPAFKPACKRRIAVIAYRLGWGLPLYALGLLGPEGVAVVDRATVKSLVVGHV